jgi:hypothetical protein
MNKKNKRGNIVINMIMIPALIFMMGLMMFVSYYVFDQIKDSVIFTDNPTSLSIRNSIQVTLDMYPFIFVMFVSSLIGALVLTSFVLRSDPAFLVVGIILLIFAILIAVPFENAWGELYNDPQFADIRDEFVIMDNVFNSLPLYTLLIGALAILALYAKRITAVPYV